MLGCDRCNGYASVADWIAHDPDNETFIFRRFDWLSARNLLTLQSEVLQLEDKLRKLDESARHSKDLELKDAMRTWEEFSRLHDSGNGEVTTRMQVLTTIRVKLKEYHEALLLQNQISHLDKPQQRVVDAYSVWFNGCTGGISSPNYTPVLGGQAKYFLDEKLDLACLKTPQQSDPVSRFLQNHWPGGEKSGNRPYRIRTYRERGINILVACLSTVLAAVLLVGSIVTLHFVKSPGAQLGILGGFTASFALSIAIMTNARRVEIFGATAAYAAVLVVFVSNANNGQGCTVTCPPK